MLRRGGGHRWVCCMDEPRSLAVRVFARKEHVFDEVE